MGFILFIVNKLVMKIHITEQQRSRLFEAMQDGFSLDTMVAQGTFQRRVDYCRKMLGMWSGNGSSRVVFDIDDETVLKLAKNKKGIEQNLEEIRLGTEPYFSSFPRIMNGSDEKNGLWIIAERVLPAKEEDFEKVLGMPFSVINEFVWCTITGGRQGYNKHADNKRHELYQKYESNEAVIELFNDIYELYMGFDNNIVDLRIIRNWGLCLRNGKPAMVMLDVGLSEDIYNRLYNPIRNR